MDVQTFYIIADMVQLQFYNVSIITVSPSNCNGCNCVLELQSECNYCVIVIAIAVV